MSAVAAGPPSTLALASPWLSFIAPTQAMDVPLKVQVTQGTGTLTDVLVSS